MSGWPVAEDRTLVPSERGASQPAAPSYSPARCEGICSWPDYTIYSTPVLRNRLTVTITTQK